ncbi:MAG TPA: hypothetical protein PKE69_16525 [Pyrinomonadaceae bacterium]|nr:hypothetical protein [Pyrinomonadaceae bacterium]
MKVWQIETTVTTVNTNLSCTVMTAYVSDGSDLGSHFWWQKVVGRYEFGPQSGKWAYWRDGILLARTTNQDDPLVHQHTNLLLVLSIVPRNFAEKLLPLEIIRGFGRHYTTNEPISWEMKFPTRPIKKG